MRRAFSGGSSSRATPCLKEAAWNYDYLYHNNHVSGVPIMPTLRLDWFMKRNSMFDGKQALPLHGGSWHAESTNQNGWYGFGANNASQFSFGGPMNLNNALMKLENAEYEASFPGGASSSGNYESAGNQIRAQDLGLL